MKNETLQLSALLITLMILNNCATSSVRSQFPNAIICVLGPTQGNCRRPGDSETKIIRTFREMENNVCIDASDFDQMINAILK